jgi:DNA-binding XRE family transcriptional regulator
LSFGLFGFIKTTKHFITCLEFGQDMTTEICELFDVMDSIDLAEAMRRFRRAKSWTQAAIAEKLGLKRTTYTAYEQGLAKPPKRVLDQLKDMGFDEVGPPKIAAPELLAPIRYIGTVSASSKADWTDPMDVEDLEFVPPEMADRGRFCCRVGSDSCFDLLWPGDLAVFQQTDVPRLNLINLYRHFDNRITIKQIKHDGREFILHPLNPKYEDEVATGTSVGYLVGIVREQGSRRVTVYDSHGIMP